MSASHCYVNGQIMLTANASISINDLGFQRGYGVFDFARVVNGKLFHIEKHLARLRHSAASLNLELPLSDPAITSIAYQIIDLSNFENACIRIQLTGGLSSGFPFNEPTLVMIAEDLLSLIHI